jgi:UDP-3-O-[3-hydroxymyristoyl] N-acetylglucosamine deacetylase
MDATALEHIAAVLKSPHQHTLCRSVQQSGIGLHTGQQVEVQIHPAPVNTGRYFLRTDAQAPTQIPAQIQALHQTVLSTELIAHGYCVRTVEHVLAALAGLGIDNACIEINGPEVPFLDGSAQPWVQALMSAGWIPQPSARLRPILENPLVVQRGDAFVSALPAPQTRLTYGIEFTNPVIGQQWCSICLEDFAEAIAPARTFVLAEDVEKLRTSGLIKGGSLENALVCGDQGWLNPPLRYTDEPVRHKLLDLLGDLSLLGSLPQAHILAYKASHALHTQFVQHLTLSRSSMV